MNLRYAILMFLLLQVKIVSAKHLITQPDSTVIEGHLTQSFREQPLNNAVVYLERKKKIIAGTVTDSTGHYYLKVPATGEDCILKMIHPGCEKKKYPLRLITYKMSFDFYLTPKEYIPTWDWVFLYCPLPYAPPGNSIYYREDIHNMAY